MAAPKALWYLVKNTARLEGFGAEFGVELSCFVRLRVQTTKKHKQHSQLPQLLHPMPQSPPAPSALTCLSPRA